MLSTKIYELLIVLDGGENNFIMSQIIHNLDALCFFNHSYKKHTHSRVKRFFNGN